MLPANYNERTKVNMEQVCEHFDGISKSTVKNWIKTGKLPKPVVIKGAYSWRYVDILRAEDAMYDAGLKNLRKRAA